MLVIFQNIAVIFALVGLGFVANRTNMLPHSISPNLTKLLLTVNLPAFILCSITDNTLTSETLSEIKQIMIIMLIFYVLGTAVTLLMVKFLRFPRRNRGLYAAMLLYTNSGFMGIPIASAVFGSHGLFVMVFENIFMTLFLYSAGVMMICMGNERKLDGKSILKSFFNYCMLASVLGIVMLFAGLSFPAPVSEFLNLVGQMTVPLSMMLVGMQLGASSIVTLLKKVDLLVFTVVKSTALPALVYLCLSFTDVAPMVKTITVLVAALPSAAIIAPLSERYGADARLAAGGVSLSTLFSMLSIPIVCALI